MYVTSYIIKESGTSKSSLEFTAIYNTESTVVNG